MGSVRRDAPAHRLGDPGCLALDHGPGRLRGDVAPARSRCPRWSGSIRSAPSAQWRNASSIASRPSGTSSRATSSAPTTRRTRPGCSPLSSPPIASRPARSRSSRCAAPHSAGPPRGASPAAPAGLLDQLDRLDLDAPLEPLDHVVDRQGGDRQAVIASISTPVRPTARASLDQRDALLGLDARLRRRRR